MADDCRPVGRVTRTAPSDGQVVAASGGDGASRAAETGAAAALGRRATHASAMAASLRSTTSRSPWRRARSSRWSAIPVRASRRCSAWSPDSRRPTRGRIAIAGREVTRRRRAFVPPEKRGVGMMFQDYALFPHLTVARERDVRPCRPARAPKRAQTALARCSTASALPRAPTTTRTRSPAASSSASRSPGRWPAAGRPPHGRALLQPRPADPRPGPRRDLRRAARERRHRDPRHPRSRTTPCASPTGSC